MSDENVSPEPVPVPAVTPPFSADAPANPAGVSGLADSIKAAISGDNAILGTAIAREIIGKAVERSFLDKVGADVRVLSARDTRLPMWDEIPRAQWRAENDPIAEGKASLKAVPIGTRNAAVVVRLSRELLADAPGIADKLQAEIVRGLRRDIQDVVLNGKGTKNAEGVQIEPLGLLAQVLPAAKVDTAGPTATVDEILTAVAALDTSLNDVTGVVYGPDTNLALATAKDSRGDYASKPAEFLALNRVNSQHAKGLTVVGDWSALTVGVREDISVQVLQERYADYGQVGVVLHLRMDVAVLRRTAFKVLSPKVA